MPGFTAVRIALTTLLAGLILLLTAGVASATGDSGCGKHCSPPPTTVTVTVTCYETVTSEVPTTVYETKYVDVPTTIYETELIPTTEYVPTTIPGGTTTETETTTATETATETTTVYATTAATVTTTAISTVTNQATVTAQQTVTSVNNVTHEVTKTVIQTETVKGDTETVKQVEERLIQPIVNIVSGSPTTSYVTSTELAAPILVASGGGKAPTSLASTGVTNATAMEFTVGAIAVLAGVTLVLLASTRRRPSPEHR